MCIFPKYIRISRIRVTPSCQFCNILHKIKNFTNKLRNFLMLKIDENHKD